MLVIGNCKNVKIHAISSVPSRLLNYIIASKIHPYILYPICQYYLGIVHCFIFAICNVFMFHRKILLTAEILELDPFIIVGRFRDFSAYSCVQVVIQYFIFTKKMQFHHLISVSSQ